MPRPKPTARMVASAISPWVHEARVRVLKSVQLLSSLSDDELNTIAFALRKEVYSDGDTIIRHGQGSASFFIINEGEVKCTKNGKELMRKSDGDFFGERALLRRQEREPNTIVASGRVHCLHLGRRELKNIMNRVRCRLDTPGGAPGAKRARVDASAKRARVDASAGTSTGDALPPPPAVEVDVDWSGELHFQGSSGIGVCSLAGSPVGGSGVLQSGFDHPPAEMPAFKYCGCLKMAQVMSYVGALVPLRVVPHPASPAVQPPRVHALDTMRSKLLAAPRPKFVTCAAVSGSGRIYISHASLVLKNAPKRLSLTLKNSGLGIESDVMLAFWQPFDD